jgi:hypothetical protein
MRGLPDGPYFSIREDGGNEGRFVVVAICPPAWMSIPLGYRYKPTDSVFEAMDFADQMNSMASSFIDDEDTQTIFPCGTL